jgi:hypothetical protein
VDRAKAKVGRRPPITQKAFNESRCLCLHFLHSGCMKSWGDAYSAGQEQGESVLLTIDAEEWAIAIRG